MPHENHVDGFSKLIPSPPKSLILYHFCPIRISPTFRAILIPPLFHIEKMISLSFILGIWHSVNQKIAWYLPNEASCEPKSDQIDKRGTILIGGCSDYYCRGLFYSNVSFRFHFYCFVDSVVFFTSSETSLHWSHRFLAGYRPVPDVVMHNKDDWSIMEDIVKNRYNF